MKNSKIKAIVIFAVLAVLVTAAVLTVCAQTHEDRVSYTVTPDITSAILPSEGTTQTVNITVDVSVLNGATVKEIKLFFGDSQEPATVYSQDITSSASLMLVAQLSAQQFNVDIPIYAIYSYTEPEAESTEPVPVEPALNVTDKHLVGSINIEGIQPDYYDIVIAPDNTIVNKNGTVIFTGTFTNKSTVTTSDTAMVDIKGQYKDGSTLSVAPVSIGGVPAGESREITFSVTNVQNDFTVIPTVMTDLGSESGESVSVALKNAEVQFYIVARPTASAQYNETISIVYTVVNSGNVALNKVELFNENYDKIQTPVRSLAPGQRIDGTVSIKVTGDKQIRYTFNAEDALGDEYKNYSNSVDVTLETSINDVVMGITAVADKNVINMPSQVSFDLAVSNKCLVPVTNIEVVDHKGQVVKTIYSMDPNAVNTFQVVLTIEETENVYFKVTVTDQEGNKKSFETDVILITLDETVEVTTPPTAAPTINTSVEPTATPEPLIDPESFKTLYIILFVIGGLIVVGVVALIVINILQKRAVRRSRRIRRRVR
ncbi:MAG: hypothetical protein IKK58_02850 [Clostridia bacterium]|nr:hypothetical protein [Clostridia bacterium]